MGSRGTLAVEQYSVGACSVIAGATVSITHNVDVFSSRNNGFRHPLQISFSQYQITDTFGERFTNHQISRLCY